MNFFDDSGLFAQHIDEKVCAIQSWGSLKKDNHWSLTVTYEKASLFGGSAMKIWVLEKRDGSRFAEL